MNNNFGFIITRHVNSEKTNFYWNNCIKCLRRFYPNNKIIIIDDNSDTNFLKSFETYDNIEIVQSEYPGRGELLPYIYYHNNKYFENAVIIHYSLFFHKRIIFEKLNIPVLPLWHFEIEHDPERKMYDTIKIASKLSNSENILRKLKDIDVIELMLINKVNTKWYGCFGCQTFINHSFLTQIENKYKISRLKNYITCRKDRCSFERILGVIIFSEYKNLINIRSLLGSIFSYCNWGYNYEQYIDDITKKRKTKNIVVKVWTGR
jgi:hypothetical protein